MRSINQIQIVEATACTRTCHAESLYKYCMYCTQHAVYSRRYHDSWGFWSRLWQPTHLCFSIGSGLWRPLLCLQNQNIQSIDVVSDPDWGSCISDNLQCVCYCVKMSYISPLSHQLSGFNVFYSLLFRFLTKSLWEGGGIYESWFSIMFLFRDT